MTEDDLWERFEAEVERFHGLATSGREARRRTQAEADPLGCRKTLLVVGIGVGEVSR